MPCVSITSGGLIRNDYKEVYIIERERERESATYKYLLVYRKIVS